MVENWGQALLNWPVTASGLDVPRRGLVSVHEIRLISFRTISSSSSILNGFGSGLTSEGRGMTTGKQ